MSATWSLRHRAQRDKKAPAMDRLFSHQLFIALVVATIAIGLGPPLVDRWSRAREEAMAQRALEQLDGIKEGRPRISEDPMPDSAHNLVVVGALVAVALLVTVGWFVALRRSRASARKPQAPQHKAEPRHGERASPPPGDQMVR